MKEHNEEKTVCGMPEKAIKKMLKSDNTLEHLKKAWRKKLRGM